MSYAMSVAQKRHVRVTLDMYVYDDLELPQDDENWSKLLGLEGDEELYTTIKDDNYSF